jgi:hypothetical protein|tara:strand:- start:5765 stop:5998 length:234 start_codon:yes stop_codon:yes gene_type:complete
MAVTTANNHAAVTPSDVTVFAESSIFVGVGGDVALRLLGSATTAVYKNVPSGSWMPVNADQVLSTGTTATNIVRVFN